jgi:hypothetical protein
MIRIVIVCAVLALLSSAASAQQQWTREEIESGIQHQQFNRIVPSGTKRTLEPNLGALNTDCTPVEGYEVRVTTPPEHGVAEVVKVQTFSTYAKDNVRSKCNNQRTPGLILNYQSSQGFHGEDAFDVEVLLPTGLMRQVHYVIAVR